jgi:hypothetical protein
MDRIAFRTASVLTALFAVLHTIGFLGFQPDDPAARHVRTAMDTTYFAAGDGQVSFGGFYIGLGLSVTAALLLAAVLSWWLAYVARENPRLVFVPASALAAFQLISLVLAFRFFFAPPAAFSAAILLCLLFAIWATWRRLRTNQA